MNDILALLDGLKQRDLIARARRVTIGDTTIELDHPGSLHQETEAEKAIREQALRDYLTYGANS